MDKLTSKSTKKIIIALALYLTALMAGNTLGLKIMPFFFGLHVPVSIFWFPIVYLMTDVIGEVYGRKVARWFVWAGLLSIAFFILVSLLSLVLPWSEEGLWAKDGYNTIFEVTLRMAAASLTAFLVAEYQDVIVFFFTRRKFGTKRFWLRSNISNVWSQFLDTTVFMVIAFAGVYSLHLMISLILTLWAYKVLMGVLYTPLSYLGLKWLRAK